MYPFELTWRLIFESQLSGHKALVILNPGRSLYIKAIRKKNLIGSAITKGTGRC